jgi:hypothetical protein
MDNMLFEYKLEIPDDYREIEGIINKPFIVNEIPVGIITEAILVDEDESNKYYLCRGVIWGRFIYQEFYKGEEENSIALAGIGIEE